jgi:hypothetical protein
MQCLRGYWHEKYLISYIAILRLKNRVLATVSPEKWGEFCFRFFVKP